MITLNKQETNALIEKGENAIKYLLERLKKVDFTTNLDYTMLGHLDDALIELKIAVSTRDSAISENQKLKRKMKRESIV